MDTLSLTEALEDLESAEDFLNYFGIAFDPAIVHVNRLHILQRFHDYLARAPLPEQEDARRRIHAEQLARAYQDFVSSDALTEKVFKVFHLHEPQTTFVPLSAITVAAPSSASAEACHCGGKGLCHSSEAALQR